MFERTLKTYLKKAIRNYPVIFLTGPRQVGKTTLLETFIHDGFSVVTLDDLEERQLARSDPKLFLSKHHPPVMIDEAQYAPELFSYIKIYVDSHRSERGLFLMTGSQKFLLMKGIQESLAGRVAIVDMLGLSGAELEEREDDLPFLPDKKWLAAKKRQKFAPVTSAELFERIWYGSFPGLLSMDEPDRDNFFHSYVQTYLQRDVSTAIYGEDNLISFSNFLTIVAARTAQVLNYADMARDAGIDQRTAKHWLGLLQQSGMIYLCQPWSNNVSSRVVKSPKVYFLDTGLCAYLTRYNTPEILEAGAISGAILETWVLSEILKSWWHNGKEAPVYYYRDKEKKEIDFILEQNGKLYPVEVKKSEMPGRNAGKNFKVMDKIGIPSDKPTVLSLKREIDELDKDMNMIPIWTI